MERYIHELFQFELESGRLDFENDPDYRDALSQFDRQYELIWQAGDHKQCEQLYSFCFELAHFSAQAAFSHSMRLGMALMCQGIAGLSGR